MIGREQLLALLEERDIGDAYAEVDPSTVRQELVDAILALDTPPEGEKTYHLTDGEYESVLFRMYHDPDNNPTRVQLAIGDKLRAQFEQQGGYA